MRVLDIDGSGSQPAGVERIVADIRDAARVRSAVDGVDTVFHNVAQVPLARDEELLRSVNVDGTVVLLDACHDGRGSPRWCTRRRARCSASHDANPVATRHGATPGREAYGAAKLAAEWACLRAAARRVST